MDLVGSVRAYIYSTVTQRPPLHHPGDEVGWRNLTLLPQPSRRRGRLEEPHSPATTIPETRSAGGTSLSCHNHPGDEVGWRNLTLLPQPSRRRGRLEEPHSPATTIPGTRSAGGTLLSRCTIPETRSAGGTSLSCHNHPGDEVGWRNLTLLPQPSRGRGRLGEPYSPAAPSRRRGRLGEPYSPATTIPINNGCCAGTGGSL